MDLTCTYSDPVNIGTDSAQYAFSKSSCIGSQTIINAEATQTSYLIGGVLRFQWITSIEILFALGFISFLLFMNRR
jgi:hypothetical protein